MAKRKRYGRKGPKSPWEPIKPWAPWMVLVGAAVVIIAVAKYVPQQSNTTPIYTPGAASSFCCPAI